MACNCYAEVTEKLTAHITEKLPAGAGGLSVNLGGYVFGISADDGISHRAACPASVLYFAPKKTTGMKRVRQTINMRASFCPFCGKNYDETEPAE